MSDHEERPSRGWPRGARVAAGLAILLMLLGVGLLVVDMNETRSSMEWENPGVRGDFWGGHLAAVSGLTSTLLLFAALLIQGKELELQRKELEAGREVAKQQAEELKAQVSQLTLQNSLTQERNEIELLLSLSERAEASAERVSTRAKGIGPVGAVFSEEIDRDSIYRVALKRIVYRAREYPDPGLEMLRLFAALVPENRRRRLSDLLATEVRELAPSLRNEVPFGSWLGRANLVLIGNNDPDGEKPG